MTAPEQSRPADEHIDAVALDLDAIRDRAEWAQQAIGTASTAYRTVSEDVPALVAEVRRLTEAENDAIRAHDDLEVKLAASMADRLVTENGLWRERNGSWRTRAEVAEAEVVTLRARLAAVKAMASKLRDEAAIGRDAHRSHTLRYAVKHFRAALATTGEGQ